MVEVLVVCVGFEDVDFDDVCSDWRAACRGCAVGGGVGWWCG